MLPVSGLLGDGYLPPVEQAATTTTTNIMVAASRHSPRKKRALKKKVTALRKRGKRAWSAAAGDNLSGEIISTPPV